MSVDEVSDLKKFIKPYSKEVQATALWLRDFVWKLYPGCNELIYDNYNTVAFGWSITEKLGQTFCSVALSSNYCHFGFYWGNEISDPEKKLIGNGNQYRYIKVASPSDFPQAYIKKLLKEAYANSLAKVKDPAEIVHGITVVKSISPKKRRPGIAPVKKKK